jgi:hypothetical protein
MKSPEEIARWAEVEVKPKFGCHCEIDIDGIEPDDCVLNMGKPEDCMYAKGIKEPAYCQYWQQIAGTGEYPPYTTDAEAVGILPVLVNKKYVPVLEWSEDFNGWRCAVYLSGYMGRCIVDIESMPTIHEAVIAAVSEVIERENSNAASSSDSAEQVQNKEEQQ